MERLTILIIEDDPEISRMVASYLEANGYEVICAADGLSGLAAAESRNPDLVLLDLMLPEMPGRELCKSLRRNRETSEIPIIMMTSCCAEVDRVIGFELGADDYVAKPFSLRELSLRIRSVLRRCGRLSQEGGAPPQSPLRLHPDSCSVSFHDKSYPLTQIEYRLLATLAERPGTAHSREALVQVIRGESGETNVRIIDAHIKRLRRKLEEAGELVKTIHGHGYRLQPAEEPPPPPLA